MHHSEVVGGSTANRRLNCPGSMELEARFPSESSPYAREGNALHDIMEEIIGEDRKPQEYLGEMFEGIDGVVTQEHVQCLQWCLDRVDPIIGDSEFDLEVWGDFPDIEDAGGTADVVVFGEDLTIVDYKFGAGVPVSAKGNDQGKFYAACMIHKYGLSPKQIHFHILQPRLDSHTTDTWTLDELRVFQKRLVKAIKHARPEYNLGPWCKFCNGTPGCPAKMEQAQRAFQWGEIAKSDLPSALAIVEHVEEWAAEVRKKAHAALENGYPIQGWKLVQKRGQRVWNPELSEATLNRRLYARGLLKHQRITSKLISPAQAEKLLGKEMVKGLWVTVEGKGTTLAREEDARPSVEGASAPRSLQNLASAMASKQTKE